MKIFSVQIDDRLDRALDELAVDLGKPSRAEVFRMAIALLRLVKDAQRKGLRLTLADAEDRVQKEILLPGLS